MLLNVTVRKSLNIAFYRFVRLEGASAPALLKPQLLSQARAVGLKGTVLLAPEGINANLAGAPEAVEPFLEWLQGLAPFAGLTVKRSLSEGQPFGRLKVKLKREIIAFGKEVDPDHGGKRLDPQELKRWLDEGRPVTLLDTRNDYEITAGTFAGAKDFGLKTFRDFPKKLEDQLEAARLDESVPVVMFCTGGIRCEKATAFAQQTLGMENVYQLEGGILRYFEDCGSAHYHGTCFVFDERAALDGSLRPTADFSRRELPPEMGPR